MKRRSFLTGMSLVTTALSAGTSCTKRYTNTQIPSGTIRKKALGKTGIRVSQLGFGSHLKKELIADPKTRDMMIKTAYDRGVNFFDVYDHSGYKQFQPMGESIRDFRKDVIVSLVSVKGTEDMQAEIDEALTVFKTDYIDLYRLYTVDDDRMAIMEKNKKEGKIRAIGVVEHTVDKFNGFISSYGDNLDYVMVIFNFHHNKAILFKEQQPDSFRNDYSSLMPRIQKLNLGVIGMKPMGSDAMVELAHKEKYFSKKDPNVAQAMLRYVYEHPEIHTTIPSMNSMEELAVNLESAYKPALSADERKLLDSLSATASSKKSAYLPEHYRFLENWARHQV